MGPGERFEATDESANAVFALTERYAESACGGILAPANGVLVPDPFEDEVVVEQANSGQALLNGRVSQPDLPRAGCGTRAFGEMVDPSRDMLAAR